MASLNEELASLLEVSGGSHKMRADSVHAVATNVFSELSGSTNGAFLKVAGGQLENQLDTSSQVSFTFTGNYTDGIQMGQAPDVSGGELVYNGSSYRNFSGMNGITYPSEVLTWRRYNNGSLLGASVMSSSGGAVDSSITGWNPPNLGYGGVKMYKRVLNTAQDGEIGDFAIGDLPKIGGGNIFSNSGSAFSPVAIVVLESLNGPANGSITHSFSGKATTYGSKGVYKAYAYNNKVWFEHTTSGGDVAGTDSNGVSWAGDSANNVDWLNGATASDMYDYHPKVAFKILMAGASELKGYVAGADLTGLSNQTFLDNAVNGIKNSSPIAFDTLGEIANAVPSTSNASAFISLNTGTRMHTFTGDGSSTEFAVAHKSGNIDVFLDGVLQIPQLSDSASGATTLISSHEYFSNDGSTSALENLTLSNEQTFSAGQVIIEYITNWGGEYMGFSNGTLGQGGGTYYVWDLDGVGFGNGTVIQVADKDTPGRWVAYRLNGGYMSSVSQRVNWTAGYWSDYTSGGSSWGQDMLNLAGTGYAYNATLGSTTIPTKIETSGTACSSVVFVDAPQSGQIVTVKTY